MTRDKRGLDVLGEFFFLFFATLTQLTKLFLGYPIYKMIIDDGSSPENSKLVLAARKRKKAKTSSYLISTSADDLRKDSPSYVAKVSSDRPSYDVTDMQ